MRLRVATYNIHHGEGTDGRVDLARVAAVIRATGADVIGLQELDVGWERSGLVDQPAELQRLTGLQIHFHATVSRADAVYGLAIASREPLETTFHPLPQHGTEEPRGAIVCEHLGITFCVAHLSQDDAARALQTEALAALASGPRSPGVVMGDLNQSRRALGPLFEAGLDAPRGWTPTAPAWFPRRQIDFVLAGHGATVTRVWTLWSKASDHLPLVAEVRLHR